MIDIIIPVYRNASLTKRCIGSVLENIHEIRRFSPRVIVVNDSPDDEGVRLLLDGMSALNPDIVILTNTSNEGFVRSANRALAMARLSGRDAILVNSDTQTFAGTLLELADVAYSDPSIGFVSPRSNNAAICTLPHWSSAKAGQSPEEAYRRWKNIAAALPRFHFTPTAIGFYIFIKHAVLAECSGFNDAFGPGYHDENELIMRAAKFGFRAALANRSFAYHVGTASFRLRQIDLEGITRRNTEKLNTLFPEFGPAIARYLASPHFRAEELISALAGGSCPVRVLVDLSGLDTDDSQTCKIARRIVEELHRLHADAFRLSVGCPPATFDALQLRALDNLVRVDFTDPCKYAIAFRIGLPLSLHEMMRLETSAPLILFCVIDATPLDLVPPSIPSFTEALWHHAGQHANGLIFMSEQAATAFSSRFPDSTRLPTSNWWQTIDISVDSSSAWAARVDQLADLLTRSLADETLFARLYNRIEGAEGLREAERTIAAAVEAAGAAESLESLLQRDDRDFVMYAYFRVLRRAPDAKGFANHLALLRRGVSKKTILKAMQDSPEGRRVGAVL